ncbi:hypothetical protein B0H11DRAFT_1959549 [Mycena galericulata]|nr:hypothetical protein B0H11DRAFT_1959549 [Mycena galericulata]
METGMFMFAANPSKAAPKRKRSSKGVQPKLARAQRQKRQKTDTKVDAQIGAARLEGSPLSLADLPNAVGALGVQIDKLVKEGLGAQIQKIVAKDTETKYKAVNELIELRTKNDQLIANAAAHEETSENLRQRLDETNAELDQLKSSATAEGQKAEAAINALERELDETKNALEEAMTRYEQCTSHYDALKKDAERLRDDLVKASTDLFEAREIASKLKAEDARFEKILINLHATASNELDRRNKVVISSNADEMILSSEKAVEIGKED